MQKKILLFVSVFVLSAMGLSDLCASESSGKAFSIIYSSDERGAITPCG